MPNLTIRNMDPDILARFNRAAGARQMTQREYLAALVELHSLMVGILNGNAGAGHIHGRRVEPEQVEILLHLEGLDRVTT